MPPLPSTKSLMRVLHVRFSTVKGELRLVSSTPARAAADAGHAVNRDQASQIRGAPRGVDISRS